MAELLNRNAIRMLTGLVFGTIALLCLTNGGLLLLGLLLVVVYLGSMEYVKVLNHKGFYPSLKIIFFSEAILVAVAYFQRFDLVALALTICAMAAFMWILFRGRQPYIANVATTILGFVYAGWFPLHLIFLRDLSCNRYSNGLVFVLIMFMAVIMTDVGCYYAGTHFGKNKLAPVISPNKTIEGAIGGALCAMAATLIMGTFIGLQWYMALMVGILCTVFAQLGDLAESLIKRDAGVKDSGDILPGHGGFLDRCDSYVFTIPVMYYFSKYFIFSNDISNNVSAFLKGLF